MKLFKGSPKLKRREVKFSPDWSARSGYGRLEGRALTAPAIFRRPTGFPIIPDQVTAVANGVAVVGVQSANNAGSASNGTLSLLAGSSIAVVDLGNPGAPWAPIGTNGVSFGAASQVNVAGGFGFVTGGAGTAFRRDYRLADTIGLTNPVSVVQTFTFESSINGAGAIVPAGNLTTPGLVIANLGGTPTINMVGTPLPLITIPAGVSFGTFTSGGRTLSYSADIGFNSRFITVTDTQPIGVLPAAGYTPAGDAIGVPWLVIANANIGGAFTGPGISTVTTSYTMDLIT